LVAAEQARQQAAREARTRAAVAQQAGARSSGATRPAPPVDASRAAAAVAEARRQLGKPYEWGAAGPDSFDCSGLTMWAWRAAGVHLDHYSGAQYDETTHISLDQLQPGDLVFFYRDLSHVGIYVGNGQMIHAPHTGDVVRYGSIYAEGSPIYAGRVTG
jgi:cell wall-associated NlpC family hydrolase